MKNNWVILLGIITAAASIAARHFIVASPHSALHSESVATAAQAKQDIQGLGYVEPLTEVRQLMMRTGGVIKKCSFQVGAAVRKGEVIVELEDATQQAQVALARRNLAMIQADAANVYAGINPCKIKQTERTIERMQEKLRHSRAEADRHRKMIATSSASQQDFELAINSLRMSEVELKEHEAELEYQKHYVTPENRAWQESRIAHAQAELELAQERVRETKLLAPFDGTVLKLLKREGEGIGLIEPEPVVQFGDLSTLRVRAEIDERYVQLLAPGQRAEVFGRNLLGRTYQGRVAYVEKVMGPKTVFTKTSVERKDLETLQVLIDLEPGFQAPTGLQVDVKIVASAREDR
jgi:multidrug resistance efflux pump